MLTSSNPLDKYERQQISEHTRLVLCDLAAADLRRPLRVTKATDWGEVLPAIERNGLLGLTYRYLKYGPSKDAPPPVFKERVQAAYSTTAIQLIIKYTLIKTVLTHITAAGLEVMVVKGPALAHLIYPDATLREFNDLDLVIRERDWPDMYQLLRQLGFRPEPNLPQPPPKLISQAILYELVYRHQETGLPVEVHFDDLLNAGLASRHIEGFWQRAVQVRIEGIPVKTLSLEDQLIHLCMHAHYHGYTRLIWLADIGLIVREHADKIDWEGVCKTIRVEEAQVGVYYTLYFLDKLLGIRVPERVMTTLRPDPFRRWWHEYYLPQEKVLSWQPMWRPDFSFYFIPLFKRLLPDLLVMGRRKEKFAYLRRLLLPSPAWLRYYYHLDERQNVTMHYLLHPLKLVYHGLAEVTTQLKPSG